jgi:hypothetical protein
MPVHAESSLNLFAARANGEVLKFNESRLLALRLCFSSRPQVLSLLSLQHPAHRGSLQERVRQTCFLIIGEKKFKADILECGMLLFE